MRAFNINSLRSIIGSAFDSYTERSSRLVKRLFRFNRKVAGSSPAEGCYIFFSFRTALVQYLYQLKTTTLYKIRMRCRFCYSHSVALLEKKSLIPFSELKKKNFKIVEACHSIVTRRQELFSSFKPKAVTT